MATFRMRTAGPYSPAVPTLDLVSIPPPVKRPRLRFVMPGQHFDWQEIPPDEYDEGDIIDMTPEATEILSELPPEWRNEGHARIVALKEPTDSAIVQSAIDTQMDYLTVRLGLYQSITTPAAPYSAAAEIGFERYQD